MAAATVWNAERRRLELRDALGNVIQVYMTEGSDPTGLPPNVTPFTFVSDDVKDMVRRAIQGDPGAPVQIANSFAADNVLFAHLGKNPPGTTTTAAGTTVAVAQSPEMIQARTNIALTAANAADAKAKLDLREQGLRNAYAAIGKADQFPAWAPPQQAAAQPGQSAPPPAPEDYGFTQQDLVSLEQDPAYVRAFTNLGGTAAAIAIMARERALDQAEAQLGERKTDLDKFNAFKALHQKTSDLEEEKGEYIADQYRDWNRQTHKITGSHGYGGEKETNPVADLSGVGRYDKAIASTRQQRDEALAAYRPKEWEWEQKNRLATDKGRLQSLQPHQWQSFFPDEAERKKLQGDAYGTEYPAFAAGGQVPDEEEARRRMARGVNPTGFMKGGDRTPEQNAELGRARFLLNEAGLPEHLAGQVAQVGIDPMTGLRVTPMTDLAALGITPETRPDLYRPPAFATGGVFGPQRTASTPTPAATGTSFAPSPVGGMPTAPPAPSAFGQPTGIGQSPQLPGSPNRPPPRLDPAGTGGGVGQTPTRTELLRYETEQQLRAIQASAEAELRAIGQQVQSIGAQLAQGMREIQERRTQSEAVFNQQMQALTERRAAQKAEFEVRIATAQQQKQNALGALQAQQTEAAGRNPYQPRFLSQPFRTSDLLRQMPPMPQRAA